jgi:hypothetical protein
MITVDFARQAGKIYHDHGLLRRLPTVLRRAPFARDGAAGRP